MPKVVRYNRKMAGIFIFDTHINFTIEMKSDRDQEYLAACPSNLPKPKIYVKGKYS